MSEEKQEIYGFDNFRLDVSNRQLLHDGRPVALPAKAFDMLVVLIENGGRLIEKDELFSRVWPDQIVEESNLTVQVSAIRKALGERKENPHYIVTVPGHGYRFTRDVLRLEEEEEELVIERHSHSRIMVETEKETGSEQGTSVALANAPNLFASDDDTDVPTVRSTATPNTRDVSVSRPTVALPPVAHVTSRSPGRRWLGAGVGTLAVFASAFVLYRYVQRALPVAPSQQITLKRLTSNGKAVNAALSPDGKLFAFVLGTKANPRSLWLGHVSGGEPIALRPPAAVDYPNLKFSPDSNSLYYVITGEEYPRGSLFRLPVFGGAPEKLRDNIAGEITFAADMKQFVFVRIDETKRTSTLVIANIDGPAERELVTRSLDYRFLVGTPAWSPDGKTIAVGAVSEDNRAPAREVLLVTVADGQLKQLTSENYGQVRKVSWLNDRELLIIAVEHTLKDAQIWDVSLPGGEVRHINSDLSSYEAPLDLSADGGSLLAIQTQTLTNIWVAPAAKLDQAKKITFGTIGRREGLYGLEWTATGHLIYSASEDNSQTLWMMEADGSKQKQLTPAGYVDEHPTATADGRFIVFQSNRSGNYEVWRMNTDGSGLLQVTKGGDNEQPSVSPDGKWVVYVSTHLSTRLPSGERLGTLWRVALEGGAPLRISDGAAAWPRVSPDGQLIACEYSTLTGSPQMKLALVPIAGGQPLKLFDLPPGVTFRYGLRWTPDGAAVAYRDWVNGIWRQPIEGGAPQRLPGLPEEKLFAYGWSPDGRQFAFTRGAEIRDVVLMRNFR
jgi:Tol biopolymer transport system component/DNA-binding winged helix-turn-helix (wHTH) protein